MASPSILLALAVEVAAADKDLFRSTRVGAVGIRKDGTLVSARNGASIINGDAGRFNPSPRSHAEARCLRKLGHGGVIYIGRTNRTGEVLPARPCPSCQKALRAYGTRKVYYTISETEYGAMYL